MGGHPSSHGQKEGLTIKNEITLFANAFWNQNKSSWKKHMALETSHRVQPFPKDASDTN